MLTKMVVGALTVFAIMTVFFTVLGCPPSDLPASTGDNVNKGDLVGPVTEERLYREFPSWQKSASSYGAKPEIVEQLRKINTKLEIVVFFGTWCGDSQSEIPKFLRIYDTVANRNFSLRMYGVDRARRDGNGMTERFGIEKVPTVIFFSNGKELGRIVEYPQVTMEDDFLAIVSGTDPASNYDGDPTDDEYETTYV
jgi:thiol-disulfide isomerase/thioredoxin